MSEYQAHVDDAKSHLQGAESDLNDTFEGAADTEPGGFVDTNRRQNLAVAQTHALLAIGAALRDVLDELGELREQIAAGS